MAQRSVCAALSAAAFLLGSVAASVPSVAAGAESVSEIVTRLRLEESATPAREHKGWRKPKKIVVMGAVPAAVREGLAAAAPGAEIVAVSDVAAAAKAATNADILVGLTSSPGICEPEILDSAKQLLWIHSLSAGVERCMAVPSVKARDLVVTNMRGVDSAAIAEHAIAMALALAHGFDTFVTNQSQGAWRRQDAAGIQTLTGKTLLVVGLGGIGTEVAKRAHGLGMTVTATRASGSGQPEFVSQIGKPSDMLALAKTADVIVNCVPLTTETTGMFNARFFDTVKPSALFVNIARGGSVVTADLVKALTEKRLAGAGLDVVDPEPLPPDHPLWHAPNVIITPHISSSSDEPAQARWTLAQENVRRYFAGDKMISVVDLKREY